MATGRVSFFGVSYNSYRLNSRAEPTVVLPLLLASRALAETGQWGAQFGAMHPDAVTDDSYRTDEWFYTVSYGGVKVHYNGRDITRIMSIDEMVPFAAEIAAQKTTPSNKRSYTGDLVWLALARRVRESEHEVHAANILQKHHRDGASEHTLQTLSTLREVQAQRQSRPWWPRA